MKQSLLVPIYSSQDSSVIRTVRVFLPQGVLERGLGLSTIRKAYKVFMSRSRTRYSTTRSPKQYTYFSPKNRGRSRLPRSPILNRGIMVSGTRGGRGVRKPKSRDFTLRIPNKEYFTAIRTALMHSFHPESLVNRGHRIPYTGPLVIQEIPVQSTREMVQLLRGPFQLAPELTRCQRRTYCRSRQGGRRGKLVTKRGILFLLDSPVRRYVANIPGSDYSEARFLNIKHVAPGGVPGRFIVTDVETFLNLLDTFGFEYEMTDE